MMPPFNDKIQTKIRYIEWDKTLYPENEDDLGLKLFSLVANRSFLGPLPLELWLFTEDAIQTVSFTSKITPYHVAGLCGLEGVKFAAILGEVLQGNGKKLAHVYIEHQNCRWWFASQALNQEGAVMLMDPVVRKASEEDDKPLGLGGWFSLSRRLGLKAKLEASNSWIH